MKEIGLQAPGNISVVGYDDLQFLDRMSPALTTVSLPKYDMGSQATTVLLEIISGESKAPALLKMQPQLLVRNSTAVAAGGRRG